MRNCDEPRRTRPARRRCNRGFSLVELMITVVVLGVVMAIAIPSFRYVQNASRISAASNELVGAMQLAKAEAIRRNARMVVCSSSNGTSCANATTWTGWIVFADTDRDSTVDAGETIVRAFAVAPPITVQSSSNLTQGKVVFRSDGFPRNIAGALLQGKVRACLATATPRDNASDVTIGQAGRIYTRRANGNGACGAPDNTGNT